MIVLDAMEYATDAAAQAAWIAIVDTTSAFSLSLGSFVSDTNVGVNYRVLIPAAQISASGGMVRVKFSGYNSHAITFTGASIGERDGSTDDYATTPTRLTFSGANSVEIPAGDYAFWSDWMTLPIDDTKDYFVHVHDQPYGGVVYQNRNSAGYGIYYNISSNDDSQTQSVSYSWLAGYTYFVSGIEVADDSGIVVTSNSTDVENGTYNMKVVAAETTSLNKRITHTLNPTFNLSGQIDFKFNVRSNRTGSNFKIGLHDSGGTTTEVTPNIASADTWQEVTLDLSAVSDANKDAIDSIIYTQLNADAENTIYLDYFIADNVTWPDAKYIYAGIDRGDGTTGTLNASTISAAAGAGSNLSAAILKDGEVVDDVIGSYAGGGIDIADIVAAQYVIEGHKNYVGGSDGTYHEAQTTEVKNDVLFGASSGLTGTYSPGGTYAEGQAAQLTIDQLAVLAKVSYIDSSQTILSQAGMLDMSLYILKSLLPNKKYLYYNIDRGDGQLGTLRAGNIHTNTGCAGVDLSASILRSGLIVDNITGTLGSVSASLSGVALIRALLESNLNLLSPALDTAWENSPFKPTTGTAYQIVDLLFAQPANLTFGDDYFVEQGIFQVTLMYPLQVGTSVVTARAEAIRTLFKRGTSITGNGVTVRIESTPEIGHGRREEDRWALPVKIRWFAGIN